MMCEECKRLRAEVATLRRMLDHSQDQEAARATRAGELWEENYLLREQLHQGNGQLDIVGAMPQAKG